MHARSAILASLLLASACAAQPLAWSPPAAAVAGKGSVRLTDGRLLFSNTERADSGVVLRVFESRDFGRTFAPLDIAAQDVAGTDLGDACLMQSRDGRIWISYRQNHRGPRPEYAIKVSTSDDGGRTWAAPTTVAESRPGGVGRFSRGLWASFLFQRADGTVLCLYDDEETPTQAGFPGHQWITAKTWDGHAWTNPTTVSRAHDPKLLSRDGMMCVVEPQPGELLCVFESVETTPPHANLIRSVRSTDNGTTWSWQAGERDVVYRAAKPNYLAISPWTIRLADGRLACVFCTDEDRDTPGVSGTPVHRLSMSVKLITSNDAGRTWSPSQTASDAKRTYLPAIVARPTARGGTELFVSYLDYDAGGFRGVATTLPATRPTR